MKRFRDILTVIVIVNVIVGMTACSSENPSLVYEAEGEKNNNQEQYGKLVIAPTMDLNALVYTSATTPSKGSGAFDVNRDDDVFYKKLSDATFNLLGYRKTCTSTGELSAQPDFRTVYNAEDNHKDCLLGSTTTHDGEPAKTDSRGVFTLYDDAGLTSKRTYYWSEAYPQIGYDFFGYYLDDAVAGTTEATTDKITIPLTIDGTQDILSGSAQTLTESYLKQYGLSDASQEVIDNILYYGDGSYSTYSAFYGVQPKINMKHAFARFVFYTTVRQSDLDFTILGIDVEAENHGTLTIASHNLGELGYATTGEKTNMPIHRMATLGDDGSIIEGTPLDTAHPFKVVEANATIGEILLPAGVEEYALNVHYRQNLLLDKETGETETIETTYHTTLALDPSISKDGIFKAGYEYPVNLNIYASKEIKVYVGNSEWQSGGSVDVDTED